MNEDILAIGGFFLTVIVIGTGLPLVRAFSKRMEAAIETMAVEIERISEGQRFVTRLLAERERVAGVLPSRDR